MVLQTASNIPPFFSFCPCAAPTTLLPLRRPRSGRNARWSLIQARACIGGGNPAPGFNAAAGTGAKSIILKRFSDEDDLSYASGAGFGTDSDRSYYANNLGQDPIVDKLRNQLGVIHPIPSPLINRNVFALFAFFFFVGVIFDKVWTFGKGFARRGGGKPESLPQVPSGLSLFFEKDLQRKESVEWVNMVLGKLWKVYRSGIENWIVGLLQPVIDNLQKPDYVQRVEIKQFSLGDEPLSVRSVERRTSRSMNDLQYQIGLRYSGGARMLLLLSLKFSNLPIIVPVGVRNFDIDGELWVKLRLIPTMPWVGAVSWAFVSLPKIKFELSLFRLFNLMAIPVLSMFLTKLLTEDLPKLFVRPNKIVLDFQKGEAVGPVPNDSESGKMQEENNELPVLNNSKSGEMQEGNNDYAGELSLTLLDARKLSYIFYGKTDPYVILKLGDQTICSKRNSQTTVIGPPGEPIWNQDFHMLVADPKNGKLCIEVKDSLGFADFSVGTAEVDLGSLKDTVPADRRVALRGGWSPFGNRSAGQILLRLTYKAYVEDEDDEKSERAYTDTEASGDEFSDSDELNTTTPKWRWKAIESDKESFINVLAALLVSEEFQGIVSQTENGKSGKTGTATQTSEPNALPVGSGQQISASEIGNAQGSTLLWLAFVTCIVVITAMSIGGASMFNP